MEELEEVGDREYEERLKGKRRVMSLGSEEQTTLVTYLFTLNSSSLNSSTTKRTKKRKGKRLRKFKKRKRKTQSYNKKKYKPR